MQTDPIPIDVQQGHIQYQQRLSDIYLIRMGRVAYRHALRLMRQIVEARRRGEIGDTLLLVEHPPVITLGRGGGLEDLVAPIDRLCRLGIEVVQTERGGRVTYHGPGQLVAYPILKLPDRDLHGYLWRLEQVVLELLLEWRIAAQRIEHYPGVWVGENKIAAVGIAVQAGVTAHGIALNVNTNLAHFDLIVPCGLSGSGVTSMQAILKRPVALEAVERSFVTAFSRLFGRKVQPMRSPGPWLIAPAVREGATAVQSCVGDLRLHTVCQEAGCPNIGECWTQGTATFLLLGDICTRHCRFCSVAPGRPASPDPAEPEKVADAAARLGLRHVVITSVARDDLADGGARHFAATIQAVRRRLPEATVEVLIPDFGGSLRALEIVAEANPDLLNHNVETVERLSSVIRPKADYRRSLGVLAWASKRGLATKSGLMVGLGESCGEVIETMHDLRRAGCDLLTIGQYLQPTPSQLEVVDYIHPTLFDWYRDIGESMGFKGVASAPLVRSSFQAAKMWGQIQC